MEMYHFVSHWFFRAPVEQVWNEITDVRSWPAWWPAWKKAAVLTPGDSAVGSVVDNDVRGQLPYSLRFRTEITCLERPRLIEIKSTGGLVGTGKWVLEPQNDGTAVTYYWDVGTANPALNLFARVRLVRRFMETNHDYVMDQGFQGLKARLEGKPAPDPAGRLRVWQPLGQQFAATALGAAIGARVLHHVDRPLLRLTNGRWSVVNMVAGLPVVTLPTTGARTGRQRTVPLVSLSDGDRVILIASRFGRAGHPAWYYNLRANPNAIISADGCTGAYVAHEAEGDERERYWRRAVELYPGYASYAERASGRRIPVMVLEPRQGG